MYMRKLIVSLMLVLSLAACGTAEEGSNNVDSGDFWKNDYKKIVSSNNGLGFHLLNEIDPYGNDF